MTVLDEAIQFAVRAHEGQTRKFGSTPYIMHPMEVASIIATMTEDLNVMAAGVLHDTVEDCDVSPEEIRARFGSEVYKLVMSETEDKLSDRPPEETWMERKRDSLLALEYTGSREVKILWLADKLSNLRSFYREAVLARQDIWSRLHQKDPRMHEWYYRSIADCMKELEGTPAYVEFTELIERVFPERNS